MLLKQLTSIIEGKIKKEATAEMLTPDNAHLEQEVRDALDSGDDYTARSFAKMATNPSDRKFLMKIIKDEMNVVKEAVDDRFYTTSPTKAMEVLTQRFGPTKRKSDKDGRWMYRDMDGNEVAISDIDGAGDRTWNIFKSHSKKVAEAAPKDKMTPKQESRYADDLASRLPKNIDTEDEILAAAYKIAIKDLGRESAIYYFQYDDDFPSDLVSAYMAANPLGELGGQKNEGFAQKLANKIMGVAPEEPKYKVGDTVSYEMYPDQKDGSGTGKITKYDKKSGHYIVNGRPVNHFEIKKVVKETAIKEATSDGVRGWMSKVREEHGTDVKFFNDKHGGGTVNRTVASKNHKTIGVFDRRNGSATVYPVGSANESLMSSMLKLVSEEQDISIGTRVNTPQGPGIVDSKTPLSCEIRIKLDTGKLVKFNLEDIEEMDPLKEETLSEDPKNAWVNRMKKLGATSFSPKPKNMHDQNEFESAFKLEGGKKVLVGKFSNAKQKEIAESAEKTFRGYDVHHNPDDITVHVMSQGEDSASEDYYGISVVFDRNNDTIQLVGADKIADEEIKHYRKAIIAAAAGVVD